VKVSLFDTEASCDDRPSTSVDAALLEWESGAKEWTGGRKQAEDVSGAAS
jgi:hypothetical protein